LYDVWWTKDYFGILYNLCRAVKLSRDSVGGQEFQFLSCLLAPICPIPGAFLKSNTIQIKLSCLEMLKGSFMREI
jgi:hypothetical protein